MFAPDTYMQKIAAGPACAGKVGIDKTPAENIAAVAEALGKPVEDVNVCILDRGRHQDLIAAVREAGARIRLIDDGDVFGAIATAVPGTGIDLYMGSGGAPEGVLACTGLKAIGGVFEGRLRFDLDKDGAEKRARAEKTAELDLDAVLTMDMLVRSDDAAFIACGVTDGEMVSGVSNADGSVTTECVVMNAADKTVRFVKTCHRGGERRRAVQLARAVRAGCQVGAPRRAHRSPIPGTAAASSPPCNQKALPCRVGGPFVLLRRRKWHVFNDFRHSPRAPDGLARPLIVKGLIAGVMPHPPRTGGAGKVQKSSILCQKGPAPKGSRRGDQRAPAAWRRPAPASTPPPARRRPRGR